MKKILAIALLLTVALVAVFAADPVQAKLTYSIDGNFKAAFIITVANQETAIPEAGTKVSETQFGTNGEFVFDLRDQTRNNEAGKYYTLSATCAEGWKRDNVAIEGKSITLTFAPVAASDSYSTQSLVDDPSVAGKKNLKVDFEDVSMDRSTGKGIKVGTLTAKWSAFAATERLAGNYTATVVVSLTSN